MLRIILKELRFRWVGTLVTIIAFAAPVSMIFAALTLFETYDRTTELTLGEKEKDVKNQIKELDEEYRKITLKLGFNILILPKEQNLGDFYADDFAMTDMPEGYAEKLTNSKMITINHLLPALFQKVIWKEKKRTILVTGIQGEIPLLHRTSSQKSLLEAVPRHHIVLGYELWKELNHKAGDVLQLNGRKFTVSKCNESRGTVDDITVWIDLKEAQEMFGKANKISAMFALECRCEGTQNLANIAKIRDEVAQILPQTQVIEFMSEALSRAEARWRMVTLDGEKITQQKQYRENFVRNKRTTALILILLVFFGCMMLVLWLTYKNVSDRSLETGLFCSIGMNKFRIWIIFSGRAVITGLSGWFLGSATGLAFSVFLSNGFPNYLQKIEIPLIAYYGSATIFVVSIILVSGYIFKKISQDAALVISKS